jgi:Flp pilus assembly protein TadB
MCGDDAVDGVLMVDDVSRNIMDALDESWRREEAAEGSGGLETYVVVVGAFVSVVVVKAFVCVVVVKAFVVVVVGLVLFSTILLPIRHNKALCGVLFSDVVS